VTLVIDAAFVVAALVDGGTDGTWAQELIVSEPLAAPHLMPVEAANILRRGVLSGAISADTASLAHVDLTELPVELFGYDLVADRVWELRENLTCYDAWYVALAEFLGSALATLDVRSSRAPGVRCDFLTPPA
jgi:predicted nucleic acid-binding protein